MKKIKIIHIITKLELGGAQQNTLYTVENLNKEIFEALLLCGKGGILDEMASKNLKGKINFIKNLVREVSPLNDLIALLRLIKILKKEKPSIIHTHSSKAGILGRIAGFLSGVPIIIHTYHGFGFNEHQNFLVRNFYIFLEKVVSLLTDVLIFVSRANIETAKRYRIGSKAKYIIIRSGIKLSDFSKEKDKRFAAKIFPKITQSSKVIVSVGNLKPQKNPCDFIKIASEVIRSQRDVYFIYAGGGSEEEMIYYRKIIEENNISDRCIITGWISDIHQVYRSADIFLLTSLWEGLPRSLIEAVASGSVPVCYETDGVKDIIKDGENGFLINKFDWINAAERIKNLCDDELLYEGMKKNIELIDLHEFDIDFMVKQQETLYLDLLK